MYTQHDEERVILEAFGRDAPPGRFLDLGAFDGRTFSNTLALAERGWSGICVEASPKAFVALMETHRDRPSIALVNAAVAMRPGLVTFHDCDDLVGTTEEGNRQKWADKVAFREICVAQVTIRELLDRFGGPIDFLSIDTEGTSIDLLEDFPMEAVRPRCVCVEHDGRTSEAFARMTPLGYRASFHDGNNLIFVL